MGACPLEGLVRNVSIVTVIVEAYYRLRQEFEENRLPIPMISKTAS